MGSTFHNGIGRFLGMCEFGTVNELDDLIDIDRRPNIDDFPHAK